MNVRFTKLKTLSEHTMTSLIRSLKAVRKFDNQCTNEHEQRSYYKYIDKIIHTVLMEFSIAILYAHHVATEGMNQDTEE